MWRELLIILLSFIIKMSQPFPLDQFRDVFQITTKMKNKLQPFFAEYKSLNMEWIVSSLQEIHKSFFDPKLDPNIKFNTIIGIKFLFDTSEVVLINLIEIYFLPKLLQIASFDAKGDEDKRGIGYFVSVGYPKQTNGIEKLSYNFVRLAAEFIQAAAIVKSKRLYYSDQLPQSSDYYDAYMKLQGLGWKPYSKLAYYKETVPTISAQLKKNLEDFQGSVDNYTNYYTQLFKAYLFKGKTYQGRLDPKRVLQSGDLYVTANTIDLCTQALHSPSIRQRTQGLMLLNDFIRWGDIQAAFQINCTDLLDEILNELAVNGSGTYSLGRGRTLFRKLQGSEQLKQQFYVQFLKAMQFWSLCFPKALKVKDRDSRIKLAHDEFRMKLRMEFPDDKNLKEHKLEFDRWSLKKKSRNKTLLTELQGDDPQYVSLVPIKAEKKQQKKVQPPKHEVVKETPQGDYHTLKEQINSTNACLNSLTQSEATLPQKIQKIKKFRNEFEGKMQNAQIDNDEQFDQLFQSGAIVLQRIDKVLPQLNKYTANSITYNQLVNAFKPKSKINDSPPKPSHQEKPSPEKSKSNNQKKAQVVIEKKEVPSPQKKQQAVHPKTIASLTHIEQKPKLAKPPILQQEIEQKIPKQSDRKSVQAGKGDSLKSKQQQKKLQQAKLKVQEHFAHQIKKVPEQIHTPIKMKQEFSSFHSVSGSLPAVSKKSLQKSIDQNSIELRRYQQQVSILPASHTIQEEKHSVNQNLFQKGQQSSFKEVLSLKKQQQVEEEQLQLEMSHNKPKNIDNVKGSYKLKPTTTVQLRSPKDVLVESRAQSRKGSRIDFQQSKVSKIGQLVEDDDDLIMMPDDNPLELSYHQIEGYEKELKENKQLSFKKCFQAEKYLLGAHKNTKLFWLQKDTMSLIKPSSKHSKSRNKDSSISIPGILSQKDKKYQDQLKYIEQQKNRKIRELQKKISNLQTEGKQMHLKIVEQDKEIMSFKADSSVANSRTKKNFYIEDQDQLFRAKVSQKNGRDRERSFYEESTRLKEPRCLQPQGKLISSRKYAEYFTTLSDQKRKKNLLKNKELLFKDQSIEFGCMSKREGENLIITFYITPQSDLQGLTYKINPVMNAQLQISVEPKNIPTIRKRKQQKVFVNVKVKSVPYHLPQIQFVYNLRDKICSQSFTVPCSFHKFIHIDPVPEKQFASKFHLNKNIIRGEEVPYSRKLLKNLQTLTEYFSNGSLMREGEPNENGEVEFGGRVDWKREKFWVRIGVKLNQFICVQAVGEDQSISSTVEFYISLVTTLLMKNIQFSQR